MRTKSFSFRGFHVTLRAEGGVSFVQIMAPNEDAGVRFSPSWTAKPASDKELEQWLMAYAVGLIDCELAGGFGILLNRETISNRDLGAPPTFEPAQ